MARGRQGMGRSWDKEGEPNVIQIATGGCWGETYRAGFGTHLSACPNTHGSSGYGSATPFRPPRAGPHPLYYMYGFFV
jgi:hypothetical protein